MAYRATEKTRANLTQARTKLLDAASNIVSKDGFSALTIKAVANLSGLAVGSVYQHFKSKDQLLLQVYIDLAHKDLMLDTELIYQFNNADQQLDCALEQFFAKALMADKVAYALFAEPISPLIIKERQQYKSDFSVIFIKIIALGINENIFNNQDPNISSNAIIGVLIESLLTPIQWGDTIMPTFERIKLIQQCQEFCIRSISKQI
ncbi:MAG: TetR/AcrR family transcriptional regulator [Gammaproteobacteria bacterium]|nr:TetR/AcrR family transcriptional regulator [Gammaproteobacteria bacterium]